MNTLSDIRKSIKKIASDKGSMVLFTGKVRSVDGEVCSVDIDGFTVTDVQLRAVINGETSKLLITPKVGSYVLLADMSGDLSRLAVLNYSEIDSITIDCENDIVINGGENKGLIQIEKLTQKLNEFVNMFNVHTHIVPNGTSNATVQQASLFNKSDYENNKIQH